jgi:hypothetical protein
VRVVRGIVVALLLGAALLVALAACGPAPASETPPVPGSQAPTASPGTPTPQQSEVVWGRVPYCSCGASPATASVAVALKDANLAVSLREQSPRDGWMYFAAIYDPHATTRGQVGAAMVAGGAQVTEGPP